MAHLTQLIIAIITCLLQATSSAAPIRAEDLRPFASTFNAVESTQLDFIRERANAATIVGLGESTHGTAEYTNLTREMMEFLATECDYNTLIIETSVGEATYLNEYIHAQRDDLTHILTKINTSWRYQTTQFIELIEWMRTFNLSNPDNPLEIHGMEMQIVAADAARLTAFLQTVGNDTPLPSFQNHLWQPYPRSEHLHHYQQLNAVFDALDTNRDLWIESQGESAYQAAYHHAEVIKQFLLACAQSHEQRKRDLRDLYMSQNVEWIIWHRGPNTKALIWAHNAHIADGVDNGIVDVLGHQLRKRFGNAYYAIATDFGTGSFYAFPANADEIGWNMQLFDRTQIQPDTFTATLNQLGGPNAFIDLRAAHTNAPQLSCLLKSPVQIMTGAGAQRERNETRPYLIGTKFDAVIYLNQTNPIQWMNFEATE